MPMEIMLFIQAMIMGFVEGLTEFLPISSTGHLILTAQLLDFWTVEKREIFEVAVQIGAISAVIYQYWGKLWGALIGALKGEAQGKRLAINLIVASIPIMVIGLTFGHVIKDYLFNAVTVAIALIVGGFIILWAERQNKVPTSVEVEDITFKQAVIIGLVQCLAVIPGTSRSGATIISGLMIGVSRTAAAEFSFFLGIPVLMGAGFLDLYKGRHILHGYDFLVLGVGMIVAFITALIVIRALVRYVSKNDFTVFAWYRIAFGIIILVTGYMGWVTW